jgi:hypothetical protein
VVVEVPGAGVIAEADVDPDVGVRQGVAITRAHHLHGIAEEGERGDGEDLVGVEGTVMSGDEHPARL